MRSLTLCLMSLTLMSGCGATPQHLPEASVEKPRSPDLGVGAVLDAQLRAIQEGQSERACSFFADKALFVGPGVDEQGTDQVARTRAKERFSALHAEAFTPTPPRRLIGGHDLASTRWAVDRFASQGQPWVVTTLFEGPGPWTIIAQSWDTPDEDAHVMHLAAEGHMPRLGGFPDDLAKTDPDTMAWVAAQITMNAERSLDFPMNFHPPLRGDSFSVGSAAEFSQSDEAILYAKGQVRPMIESGQLRYGPLEGAGSILRMSSDQKAGAILRHTRYILEGPKGDFELPMKTIGFFIQSAHGPRFVGAHLMATP